jgi:adenylate cyclase
MAMESFHLPDSGSAPPVGVVGVRCANPYIDWMLSEGWNLTDPPSLIKGLAQTMVAQGVAVLRLRVTIRTLHPQAIGHSFTWHRDSGEVEVFRPPHSILQTDQYLKSPYAAMFEGAGGIRRRLDVPGAELEFPILQDLHAEGATDYVAMPLVFLDGKINAITLATDRAGGFTTEELQQVYDMLAVLARLLEVHAMHYTARTLLDTYLGKVTGQRVLDGLIKRGDGEDINAVIWFCDLRGSTELAEDMAREDFLSLLNEFFDCMAGAVLDHGGEVLRFVGDAALAIFPIVAEDDEAGREACTRHDACRLALMAAGDAMERIDALNQGRGERDAPPVGFGIGLHIGDVLYGNIGVPERLEFTVVGAAANEAARLEGLCKTLKLPVLISGQFAQFFPGELASVGRHALRGVAEPQEIFTLPGLLADVS